MIVFKNKTFSTNSLFPNSNWTSEENVFIINDSSELSGLIKNSSPYFDFILNEGGDLIGITPTERPPAPPPEPTETELLGQQLVEKDLQILELQQENQLLGQQLVDIDLRLLMGGL